MWQYSYDNSVDNTSKFEMSIENVEIEGIESTDYSCKKCDIFLDRKDSKYICPSCEANTYFDKEKVMYK